jgi:cAMP-dependent protein kinase regulator
LYVVDMGELNCFKKFDGKEEDTLLKVYYPGEAFGELALLYNAPRAATIIAKTDSILFSLDRECFNHIVKDAAAKKRQKYENLLESIELLDAMDNYERSQIADALLTRTYEDGEYVVTQVCLLGRERHHLLLCRGRGGHRS